MSVTELVLPDGKRLSGSIPVSGAFAVVAGPSGAPMLDLPGGAGVGDSLDEHYRTLDDLDFTGGTALFDALTIGGSTVEDIVGLNTNWENMQFGHGAYALLFRDGTVGPAYIDNSASTSKFLRSAGTTGYPAWTDLTASYITDFAAAVATTPPASHVHSAADITSGTLALARGGTNADNSSQAVNLVFASPGSGGSGAASFRALVAADIPSLDAAKITSGSLADARLSSNVPLINAANVFTNASNKFQQLVRIGSGSNGTGLVIGDQSAALDPSTGNTSNLGLTLYVTGAGITRSFNMVNQSTSGSGIGASWQVFGVDTSSNVGLLGQMAIRKAAAWTVGTPSTYLSDFRVALNNGTSGLATLVQALLVTSGGFVTSGTGNDFVAGASGAVATNATAGFLYIPTCAGTPTGVPAGFTGKVALIYDTTNNKLCVYNGAWKQTAALT